VRGFRPATAGVIAIDARLPLTARKPTRIRSVIWSEVRRGMPNRRRRERAVTEG